MTSSMLTGERRFASARRGGMTIIGKVAVPKPINLPSQRLENHGLNRDVEIVPKGTLSWGNKPSTASNAWGTSTPSPTTDGGSASPSHLSGRPSSGGSGTRPSTAGSDRSHEPTNSVWGPKSRPSSSSGVFTSNQISSNSLRPNSAETRPGSSQLSRFAESSDNSVAWGSGAAERLDATNSKHDDFSLFYGDFPTLGSEKDNDAKNTHQERDTHSRPGSSSSRPGSSSSGVPLMRDRTGASPSGDVFANSNVRCGNVNTWRNDNTPHDGFRPNMEMWQGEPHSYQNVNMPPRPFGPWHGNHTPGGPWYRGPPGGPPYVTPGGLPYGAPGGPGGFPMEYPPYYHGQIPATGLPNSQGVPPPVALTKTGDMYRPHMPDAFIRPGMPIRPGFYPGPVPYEGYYGPPMGYCNPNERDMPFVGVPPGPGGYNGYMPGPGQAPPNSNISQASGHDSSRISEQMEPHPQDPRGQKTVLLKHRNGWNRKDEEQRWENAPSNASNFEKADQTRAAPRDSNWRPDYKKNGDLDSRRDVVGEVSPQRFNKVDRLVVRESDSDVCASPEISETPNDITLIQKIEGLNAKARTFDGKHEAAHVSGRELQQIKLQAVNDISHARTVTPGILKPSPENAATGDKGNETAGSETLLARKTVHGQQGRVDHRGKGRFNAHEADGWQKKASSFELSNFHMQERDFAAGIKETPATYLEGNDDPSDIQEQRAKMKEKAKQRAEQLQKEEEERTREQRAKALAKLEELNRRSQSVEDSTEKMDNLQPCEPTIGTSMVEAPNATCTLDSHNIERNSKAGESDTVYEELPTEAPKKSNQVSVVTHNRSSSLKRDGDSAGAAIEIAPLYTDDSVPKQRQTGHEQKPKTRFEKSPIERPASSKHEASKTNESDMKVNPSSEVEAVSDVAYGRESSTPVTTNAIFEPSVDQRKKNNRSGRNKSKQDEKSPIVVVPEYKNTAKSSAESSKQKPSDWELDTNPVEPITMTKDLVQSVESHGRVNNQWKSQNPRRQPKSQQTNRPVDKFNSGEAVVWAPVRLPTKTGTNDEASIKTVLDEESTLTTKKENPAKNNRKSNRAEMERYVPKPVAKELAQQSNIQQPISPSSDKMSSDGTVGRDYSHAQSVGNTQPFEIVVGKIRISTGVMIGDNNVKAHGLWPQQGSTELTNMQVVQDGSSLLSKPNTDVQEPVDHSQQPVKHDLHSVKEVDTKFSDGWNMPDEWNPTDDSNSVAPMTSSVVKDQKFRGREKRYPYKGRIGTGNNNNYVSDHKTTKGGNKDRVYSQSSAHEVNEIDRTVNLKDNSFVLERSTSQWQPKSQASYTHNERASGPTGSQNVVDEISVKKESVPRGGWEVRNVGHPDAKREEKVSSVKGRPYSPSVKNEEISGWQASNVGPHDAKREKKVSLTKGPHLQNEGSLDLTESSTDEGLSSRHDQQRLSSGFPKYGNQNYRYGRGNESRRDWNSDEQDNKQQNQPTNQERQLHNVGAYNRNKANNFEGPIDSSSSRFRERGQHHPRRGAGNSYGRQYGTVADYE